jgi:hypothetical protein
MCAAYNMKSRINIVQMVVSKVLSEIAHLLSLKSNDWSHFRIITIIRIRSLLFFNILLIKNIILLHQCMEDQC